MDMHSPIQMTQPRLCIPVVPREIRKVLCLHIGISYTRCKPIGSVLLCTRFLVILSRWNTYFSYCCLKRVGLSFFNVFLNSFQIKHLSKYVPAQAGDKFLSMLPSWHAYERACEYFIFTCGVEQMYTSIRFLKVILIIHFHYVKYLVSVILHMSVFLLTKGEKDDEYSYPCAINILKHASYTLESGICEIF